MIANLMREHDALRRLAGELEESLGPALEAGWDDCSCCDLERLQAKQAELSTLLIEHEAKEKTLLNAAFRRERDRVDSLSGELDASHQTLADLLRLLRTVAALFDGRHVYALRAAVRRVREELGSHLEREERIMFPLFNRSSKRRRTRPRVSASRAPTGAAAR